MYINEEIFYSSSGVIVKSFLEYNLLSSRVKTYSILFYLRKAKDNIVSTNIGDKLRSVRFAIACYLHSRKNFMYNTSDLSIVKSFKGF